VATRAHPKVVYKGMRDVMRAKRADVRSGGSSGRVDEAKGDVVVLDDGDDRIWSVI